MSWNHRVVRHKSELGDYLQIHEVYYDDKSNPTSLTETGIVVGGDSIKEIRWTLKAMTDALDKPVLEYDDF